MPQPPPPISYANLVALFTTQLTISIHTILSARDIYPSNTFIKAKAYNFPIMQSRHPGVCDWINDAVKAVHIELLKGTVARVVLVIFEAYRDDDSDEDDDLLFDDNAELGGEEDFGAEIDNMEFDSSGSPIAAAATRKRGKINTTTTPTASQEGSRPLERYIWDVSRWPAMPKSDLHTPFSHAPSTPEQLDSQAQQEDVRTKHRDAMKLASADLHEQFRGLLARLATISSRIQPLRAPEACTYAVCLELKAESDPPIGHPQPWIPAETPLQRRVLHGEEEFGIREKEGGRLIGKGSAIGGVRTTPVRTVDSGEMVFEMWIEEGKAKFEQNTRQSGGKGNVTSS